MDADAISNSKGLKISFAFQNTLCDCHLFKARQNPRLTETGMHHSTTPSRKELPPNMRRVLGGHLQLQLLEHLSQAFEFRPCSSCRSSQPTREQDGDPMTYPFPPKWDSSNRVEIYFVRSTSLSKASLAHSCLLSFLSWSLFSNKPLVPLTSPYCRPLRESNWHTLFPST